MDRHFLKTTIEKIEKEKSEHSQKYANHPSHQNCLPNFDQALASLQAELDKLEHEAPEIEAESVSGQ